MANVRFTEFPSAATLGGTDIIPIVQDGANKKITGAVLATYIGTQFVGLTGNQTVACVKTFSSQLISTVAIGTAPFSVVSTTKVTNLNADLLDGLSSAAFQTVLTNPITGTGTTNYLPKFTGASALGNSIVSDNGTRVTIDGELRVAAADADINLQGTSKSYLLQIVDSDNRFRIYDNTANAERFTLTSAGNVGIGTTTPQNKLHSYGGAISVASEDSYSAKFSNNSNKGVIIGYDTTNNQGHIGSINPSVAWTDLVLNSNGGAVLIGTTTNSGYKLNVNGSTAVNSTTTSAPNGQTGLYVLANGNANNYNGITFQGVSVTDMYFGRGVGSDDLVIRASTGETARFRTNGGADFAGAIAINNTVAAAVAVASTHKVTIVIGGVTYYLLATT